MFFNSKYQKSSDTQKILAFLTKNSKTHKNLFNKPSSNIQPQKTFKMLK